MITEDYVSFETAKLLKEKGFDEDVYRVYETNPDNIALFGHLAPWQGKAVRDDVYPAPTLSMAIKWLREVHRIVLVIDYDYECTDKSYCYKVYCLRENGKPERVPIYGVGYDNKGNLHKEIVSYRDYERSNFEYAKYEEACNVAIKYCLENLI